MLADGSSYDSTFGTNGLTQAINIVPNSVCLDPSGRILVTGGGFSTARFLGDSSEHIGDSRQHYDFSECGSHQQSRFPDRAVGLGGLDFPEFANKHKHRQARRD